LPFPTLQHLDAAVDARTLGKRQLFDHVRDSFQPPLAIVQMWDNLVSEESGHRVTQFGDGFVMRAAFTRHINHSRGANFAKELEALAPAGGRK